MDTIELRAASERLTRLHGRFAPCFGRRECREHALGYLRGLLLGTDRKNIESMALVFGEQASCTWHVRWVMLPTICITIR